MNARPLTVTTVADARAGLSGVLRSFRADPAGAQSVVLGSHRKAEAVIMPYARFEQILAEVEARSAARADDVAETAEGRHPEPENLAATVQHLSAGQVDRFDDVDRAEQIERWLRGLDSTLATAEEIVERGRDAFREDAALPLACEALAARVGEIARLLRAADPERFDDPMWSLVARSQEIVVQHYSRVDEQMMWVTVAEGFPEVADLVARERDPEFVHDSELEP